MKWNKLIASLLFFASVVYAQDLRIVVPFGPGSQGDLTTRHMAHLFEKNTGQNVVVETIPGGDSIIGINHFKSTAADVILLAPGILVYNPVLKKDLPYDPDNDFDHIVYVATTPFYYIVNGRSEVKNLHDLLTKHKGFAAINTTVGEANLLALNRILYEPIKSVPFKSSPDVVMAVANGTVDLGIVGPTPSVIELAKAGKITIIGTTHRNPATVDGIKIPSVSQRYGISQFSEFFAYAIRPGMSQQRATWIKRNMWEAAQDPSTKEKVESLLMFAEPNNDAKHLRSYYQELRNNYKRYVEKIN